MSALRVLAALFDVDTGKATTKIQALETKFAGVKETLASVGGAIVGAFAFGAVKQFINAQIEAGSVINDTAAKLGVSTDALQKFQFAAGLAGVSSEGAATALQFLNKNLGEAIGGGAAQAKTFAELGISLDDVKSGTKSAADLLPDIAKAFENTGSDAERTTLAMKVFGKQGAALIPLLKEGSGELEKLYQEFETLGGGLDQDFIEKADTAGDELDKLKFGFNGLKSQLAVAILPGLTDFAKRMQRIVGGLRRVAKETNLAKHAWQAMGVVASVSSVKAAFSFGKLLGILPRDAGFWRSALGLGLWGLFAAAVIGLALVFEDLWTGIQGGNSAIRDWLNSTLGVEETNELFHTLRQIVADVQNAFVDLGPALKPVLTDLMKMAKEAGPGIAQAFVFVVKVIAAAVRGLAGFAQTLGIVVGAVGKLVGGDNSGIDNLGRDLGKAIDSTGNAIFGKGGLFGDQTPTVPGMIGPPAPGAAGPMTVQNTVPISVTVQGGQTNAETGRAVAGAVRNVVTASDTQAALAAVRTGG